MKTKNRLLSTPRKTGSDQKTKKIEVIFTPGTPGVIFYANFYSCYLAITFITNRTRNRAM